MASFAARNIPLGIFFHLRPPVGLEECALHLPCSRVSSGRDVVLVVEHSFTDCENQIWLITTDWEVTRVPIGIYSLYIPPP